MPCDTRLKANQTLSQRKAEIKRVVEMLDQGLRSGRVKAKISPRGAIAFVGLSDDERDGVTDACIYRRMMVTGSSMAKVAIARAEQMAGRTVDRAMLAQGHHGHADSNGTVTWHDHKG